MTKQVLLISIIYPVNFRVKPWSDAKFTRAGLLGGLHMLGEWMNVSEICRMPFKILSISFYCYLGNRTETVTEMSFFFVCMAVIVE